MDIRIAVKPVFSPIIHSDVWEGPCRPTTKSRPEQEGSRDPILEAVAGWSMADGKTPEQERADAEEGMQKITEILRKNLNPDIQLLDPVLLDYSEDFWISPEKLSRLEQDKDKVDVYLYRGTLLGYPAAVIAETFRKPIVLGGGFGARDVVARLKTRGLEGYAVFNEELNPLLARLKTRKAFEQTRILIVTDREMPPLPIQSCVDVNVLEDKFGIGSHFVSYREFAGEMDEVIGSKEWRAKAKDRAEQLIKNAEKTYIDKKHVQRSFEFYYAVKNLMQKYDCNAFTIECFELCASRLADKYLITPCLVHTLLKDEGKPIGASVRRSSG